MDGLKEPAFVTFVIHSPRRGCLLHPPGNSRTPNWADEATQINQFTKFALFRRTEGEAFLADLIGDVPDAKLMQCVVGSRDYALATDLNSAGIPHTPVS